MLPPPSLQHAQLDLACCHRIGVVRLQRAHRCWGHQVRGLRSARRGRWQPRHGVTAEATLKRSVLRASRPIAPALAGEPAACTSNSTSTTPSARHTHSARAAQLVHMLTVSLNLWQEGSTSCGCTRATRLVVVVTILLRYQVRQSDDPCAPRAVPACMHATRSSNEACARA
jgi:hypothetical protein